MKSTTETAVAKLGHQKPRITKGVLRPIPKKEKGADNIPSRAAIAKSLDIIKGYGIPDPWQKFGTLLSKDGSLSTQLVEAVAAVRTKQDVTSQMHATQLFERKLENLAAARSLLRETMDRYDTEGTWEKLDAALKDFEVSEAIGVLSEDFAIHPFPVVLKSLEFNWNYMKQHGIRRFYEMTDQYLSQIKEVTENASAAFRDEAVTGIVKPYWLIRADLLSIEVPTHCDVCRLTIAVLLGLRAV